MFSKNKLLPILFGLIVILISCDTTQNNLSSEQTAQNYFQGLNSGDFSLISDCISDSILTTENDYILTKNRSELYRQFQWDSVFNPNYELTSLTVYDKSVEATVSKTCKRIKFLQDSALIYKVRIIFKDNQIVKIQTTEYVFLDFEKWQARRNTLTTWIDKNYPELNGFVNDLSLKGAQNYLKAIDLYENKKKKF